VVFQSVAQYPALVRCGGTGVVSPNSGSIKSNFGPKIRRSDSGIRVRARGMEVRFGNRSCWPEAWGGPGSGAMTAVVGVPYRRAPPTILHRQTHLDQFMTISPFSCLLPIYSDCSIQSCSVSCKVFFCSQKLKYHQQDL
jgi:hypothetical protein